MANKHMDRALGYIIGAILAGLVLLAIGLLFGGALIGVLSALIAFPVAAPMTTTALLAVLLIGYFAYRRKKRRDQDRP